MTVDVFDRDLPSPISSVLELSAASPDAVVVYEERGDEAPRTGVQQRMVVDTGLERRLIAELDREPVAAVILSGSAGGGKTLLLKKLKEEFPDRFGRVVEDATHAETPDQTQTDMLSDVFAALADGAVTPSGPPVLVAMNTGMVIRWFDALRQARGAEHGFTALERELKGRLLLRPPAGQPVHDLPGGILVVNLDGRRTAGGPDSLLHEMLGKLAPDLPGGIMDGAARCASCQVRAHCFVRTNAEIVSAEPARTVISNAAAQISLRRGRALQPRAGWDLLHQMVTGGERFPPGDPCDRIAEIAADDGGELVVWERLVCNGIFVDGAVRAAADLVVMDPSFVPSETVHDVMTSAGVDPADDADRLERLLGAGDGEREAVRTAATALRGEVPDEDLDARAVRGRGLVRAAAFAGHDPSFELPGTQLFSAALDDYRRPEASEGDSDAASDLADLVEEALTRTFGERAHGGSHGGSYFLIDAFDPRRSFDVLVNVDLQDAHVFKLKTPDPAVQANPEGARVVDYQPLAVLLELAGVELRVDLPLYRLLEQVRAGAVASTADLEGFYHLRRAAEALGRLASEHDRALLIRDRRGGNRYILSARPDRRGRNRLGLEALY